MKKGLVVLLVAAMILVPGCKLSQVDIGLTLGGITTAAITAIAIWPIWVGGCNGETTIEGEIEGEPIIEGEIVVEGEAEGEEDILVPNLTGLTEAQARARISATCLVVGTVLYVDSDTVPAGRVISWNPTGTVACGTAINLVISTGPLVEGEIEGEEEPVEGEIEGEPVIEGEVIIEGEPEGEVDFVIVPDLSGLTENQARNAVSRTCLIVGTVLYVDSSTIPAGYVVSWSPTGRVVCGTAINIVVSTGSEVEGEIEGEPVIEGEIVVEGEIEGEGEFIPMSVKILAPASGQVFEVNTVVNVRVLPKGDPSKGPFRLVVSCAGKKGMSMSKSEIETLVENHLNSLKKGLKNLPTDVIPNVEVGVDHISVFTLTIPGTAYFLSYLEDKDGNYVTDSAAYSVATPSK